MGDADKTGAHVQGLGDTWEISVPFPQFCCEPKTAVKIKVLFFLNIDCVTPRINPNAKYEKKKKTKKVNVKYPYQNTS